MLDPATGKKKIKTFKGYNPQSELNAPAVVAEFIRQQETLLLLLREARHADLNSILIPISKPLTPTPFDAFYTISC